MAISITLPAEIERQLQQWAALAGQDVASLVQHIVTEALAGAAPVAAGQRSHAEFSVQLRRTIQRHGIRRGQFDDSRESIHAGRGE